MVTMAMRGAPDHALHENLGRPQGVETEGSPRRTGIGSVA